MLAKSVVGALERVVAGEPLGDAATPAVLTFLEILFADTAVQAVKPLPPPWALETSRGVKAALAEITGAGDAFNVAAVVSALVAPSHLTVDTPLPSPDPTAAPSISPAPSPATPAGGGGGDDDDSGAMVIIIVVVVIVVVLAAGAGAFFMMQKGAGGQVKPSG